MPIPPKPLSMKADAVRQRRRQDRIRLEKEAAYLSGAGAPATAATPKPDQAPAANPSDAIATPAPIRFHSTKTINIGGPDRFAAVPVLPPSSDGAARPIIPPSEEPAAPSDTSTSASAGANPTPPTPVSTITPAEAKLFAKALGQYFEFGTAMLLAKRPEFADGLVVIAGGNVDEFRKNFGIAKILVEGCGERLAIKYNLRIPYMDEAVVIGAIGIASFGLASKPSKAGAEQIKHAQEQQRADAAKDANPPPPDVGPPPPPGANGKSATPPPADPLATPINFAAGGVELA